MPYVLDVLDEGCKCHRRVKLQWVAEDEEDFSEELEDFNVFTKDIENLVHDYTKYWTDEGHAYVVNREDLKIVIN
jgi:hypothetical protein